MKTLFEKNACFDLVSLQDLGSRYLPDGPEQIKVIGFQRNAVWKEEKVEALWDSFLSGFPVGSILLARHKDFQELGVRNAQLFRANRSEDTIIDDQGDGYVVVDGQQRLNGIAQGFMSFDKEQSRSRLWIDLAEPTNPDQRRFEFYLCTSNNPFGVNGPDALTRDEKRRALATVSKENADDTELSLMDTYPYKSKLAVPFYEFWKFIEAQLAGDGDAKGLSEFASLFSSIEWHLSESVLKYISAKFTTTKFRDIDKDFLEPLKNAVLKSNNDDNYQIPVILVQKTDPERLGKLFERVNINGEVPPQAELFFSALKLRYPLINNYVAHVFNDDRLRGLLKPTDIVLAAIRLVNSDITRLDLNRFDRIAKDSNEELVKLMEPIDGQPARFTQCLTLIYDALHYDESKNPIGLPRQFIQTLRPRVWQIIAMWVNANFNRIKENKGIEKEDRLNLIRFALLDSLNFFIVWSRGVSAYINNPAFQKLLFIESDLARKHFPALEIFKRVKKEVDRVGYSLRFSTPLSYNNWLNKDLTPTLPTDKQLSNEHAILMYAQRHYLTKWENYHVDVDHIAPSQWMIFKAGPLRESVFWKVPKVPSYQRYQVSNRTGNFRYWPDSLNRRYHDSPPNVKFIHRKIADAADSQHNYFHMATIEDILKASAIDLEDAKEWEALCEGNLKLWTAERFASFKHLVYKRRYRMYKHMFEALQWAKWEETINGD